MKMPHGMFPVACRGKRVALDVALGLHHLHSLKLTHFDIKSGKKCLQAACLPWMGPVCRRLMLLLCSGRLPPAATCCPPPPLPPTPPPHPPLLTRPPLLTPLPHPQQTCFCPRRS